MSNKKKIKVVISRSYEIDESVVDGEEHAKHLALKQFEYEVSNDYLCEKDFKIEIEK